MYGSHGCHSDVQVLNRFCGYNSDTCSQFLKGKFEFLTMNYIPASKVWLLGSVHCDMKNVTILWVRNGHVYCMVYINNEFQIIMIIDL